MLHWVVRRLVALWLITSDKSWRGLPRPTDAPVAHASGVTPDRVLFVGSGPVVGYGVLSHDLSLSGEVARQAAQITGRGMDVDIVADPDLDVVAATQALAGARVSRYDAIVLVLGSLEVVTFFPLPRWKRDLTRLLEQLSDAAPAALQIVVVGVPPFEKIVRLPLLGLFASHGRKLNGVTESVVAGRRNVTFLPLNPEAIDLVANAGRTVHVRWAAHIAPCLAGVLSEVAPGHSEPVNEGERLSALARLRVLDSEPDDIIQNLVDLTRGLFDASGAAFNLIDSDRQWSKAASGLSIGAMETPRADAFCATTITQPQLLVIEDMTKHAEFSNNPYVTGPPGLRFYAGYPIEAPDGQRVGALCIIDTQARHFGPAEAMLLRDLALRAQAMLWDRIGARPNLLDR